MESSASVAGARSTMHVAYFADAIFPDESNLPHFQKRLPADKE